MTKPAIPQSLWIWGGHAGHLIVAAQCQFHMHTRVGHFIISTVGEYKPTHPSTWKPRVGGDYAEFEDVGAGRLFETFVFPANLDDDRDMTPSEFMEIDSLPADDHDTAQKNHMEMCVKYSHKRRVPVGVTFGV